MKCQRCQKQATLHITEVLGEDRYEEVHLCEDCAKKYLIEPQKKGGTATKAGATEEASEEAEPAHIGPTCDQCGISYLEFRNHGRFGCAHDYDAFKGELLPLLESIHGDLRHVGKTPRRLPRTQSEQVELTALRRQLQQFVTDENYEEAARVRDRIKELEQSERGMKCQICDNPASVHVSETVNKKKRELHLCEKCARERNLIPEPPGPQLDLKALLNLLMQPFPKSGEPREEATPAGFVCEVCGLTLAEFKAEGRLGCQHDYEALRATLEPLLERIHRAVTHAGKAPRLIRVREWKKQMQKAVAAEDYEEAARLRDLIRQAEPKESLG